MPPKYLEPSIKNINLYRQEPGNYTFDKDELKKALTEDDKLKSAFYNKTIQVNLHSGDSSYGHVSADLPCLQPDGSIQIEKSIGFSPKDFIEVPPSTRLNSIQEMAYNTINTIAKPLQLIHSTGKVSSEIYSADNNATLTTPVRLTQEVFFNIAQLVSQKKQDPKAHYGALAIINDSCVSWADNLFKEGGIVDGLKNKFNYDDFIKMDWKPVKIPMQYFFDERLIDNLDLSPIEEYKTSALLQESMRKKLDNDRQKVQEKQLDSDLTLFLQKNMSISASNSDLNLSNQNNIHSNDLLPTLAKLWGDGNLPINPKHYGLTFLKQESDQFIYQLNPDSPLNFSGNNQVNRDIQDHEKFANEIAQIIVDSASHHSAVELPSIKSYFLAQADNGSEIKNTPVITDVKFGRIGSVANGVVFKVQDFGEIGVGMIPGGGLAASIKVNAEFQLGAGFLDSISFTFGVGTAIGIGLGAIIYVAISIIKRNQKRIKKHLDRHYQETEDDINLINNKTEELFKNPNVELGNDLDGAIEKINEIISLISSKILRLERRANYAAAHKNKKTGKDYQDVANTLREQRVNITLLNKDFKKNKITKDFFEKHGNDNYDELIALAKKNTLENLDQELPLVRQLIINKAIELMKKGDFKTGVYLLSETASLKYFPKGEFKYFHPSSFKYNPKNNNAAEQGLSQLKLLLTDLNSQITQLNNRISKGEDLESDLTRIDNNIKGCKSLLGFLLNAHGVERKDLKELSPKFDSWSKNFNTEKEKFKEGNIPKTLDLSSFLEMTEKYSVALNYILEQSCYGEFDNALKVAYELKKNTPENYEFIEQYIKEIERLKRSPDLIQNFEFWLAEIESYRSSSANKNTASSTLIISTASEFLIRLTVEKLLKFDFLGAENILTQWESKNPDDKYKISILRNQNTFFQDNHKKNDTFWFTQLTQTKRDFTDTANEHGDVSTDEENNIERFRKSIIQKFSLSILNQRAGDLSNNAFFGKAAAMLKKIQDERPDLDFNNTIKELNFYDQGQLLNAIFQPLEAMLTLHVSTMQPGWQKISGQAFLAGLSTTQIFVPNTLPLFAQGAYAYYVNDTKLLHENIEHIKLDTSLILQAPYYFFKDRKLNASSTQLKIVALMYSQISLAFLQYSRPVLERVLPERALRKYDSYRPVSLRLLSASVSSAFVYNAFSQLTKFGYNKAAVLQSLEHAQAPFNVSTLAKFSLNTISWIVHKYLSNTGSDIESEYYYRGENILTSACSSASMVMFVHAITGGLGWQANAATALSALAFVYENTCEVTIQNCAVAALIATMNNIHFLVKKHPSDYNQYIKDGLENIERILVSVFSGFHFNESDLEVVNAARALHFFYETHRLTLLYKILKQTKVLITEDNIPLISEKYRMPGYMAFNTIIYLRLAKTCEYNIDKFRDEYEKYSEYIFTKAPSRWIDENLNSILDEFKKLIKYAFQRYIVAAEKADVPEKREAYLDNIMCQYNRAPDWSVLLDIEFKVWAAYFYCSVNNETKAKIILDKIDSTELKDLIRAEQKTEMHCDALAALIKLDTDLCYTLFSDDDIAIVINDQIKRGKFRDALKILNDTSKFNWESTFRAKIVFLMSKKCNPVQSLKILDSEKNRKIESNRNYEFWQLLLSIAEQLYESVKYTRRAKNKEYYLLFFGLQMIAIDRILSLPGISGATVAKLSNERDKLSSSLKQSLDADYEQQKELWHKCLRGETEHTLYENVMTFLSSCALFFNENSSLEQEAFIPIETLPDGECAFTCFGMTRENAIQLLRENLENLRNTQSKKSDIDRIHSYLDECRKKDIFTPYTDKCKSVHRTVSNQTLQGLTYKTIIGDGHCLFSAIGESLNKDAIFLRQIVAAHLKENIEEFKPYYADSKKDFKQHIESIRSGNEWGDHIEIEVIQRLTKRPVIIVRPDANPTVPDNLTQYNGSPIFVYFNDHNHYDAFTIQEGYDAHTILTTIQAQIAQGKSITYKLDLTQSYEHSHKSCGILDVLAFINKKNLRIFRVDSEQHLVMVTNKINGPDFETINILHTSVQHLTDNTKLCDHFVLLEPLHFKIQEIKNKNVQTDYTQSPILDKYPKGKRNALTENKTASSAHNSSLAFN